MKICLLFKNLFSYDIVLPPPINLPDNIDSIYLTDNKEVQKETLEKGWKYSYITEEFLSSTSSFEKRKVIAYINCYPEKVIPEINKYDYVFICDSNVVKLDTNYGEFINNSSEKYALYVTSGYYSGLNNNILRELERSVVSKRWSYNFKNMIASTNEYLKIIENMKIDYKSIPVVSAKYIGWNIHHERKNIIADYVFNEYSKHLQGNIIFSMCLVLHSSDTLHYTEFLNDGIVYSHVKDY
jgi:hypothetical protein